MQSQLEIDTRGVLVQHSVDINRPIEAVCAALAAGPRKWFPRFDDHAETEGVIQVAGLGLYKEVTIEVGEPLTAGSRTSIPVTWRATFIQQLFPVMTGTVELALEGPRTTRLTVCGMYQPPVGRLRSQLDEALLHKVATLTVKDFAQSIAKWLETGTADATGVLYDEDY